ncbi:hypothetical protein GCM10009730_55390 [Streptomyces albidochromogenes]|uniref:GGDEF domain-containing protein n=1 Tax=Streptomyces albidochromogenes TaxID=329524 RepID=UPI002FEBDBCC
MTTFTLPRKHLHITAAAVPLAGWTAHTIILRRRLAAAQRDLLTGTLRREPFLARAQRILERHPHDAVLILADADHFKALNDTSGHAAGDTALATIGTRLTEWVGKRGTVGRLGGDEFAALTRIRPRHQALRLKHLALLLDQPLAYDGEQLPLAVSAGAATPDTVDTRDLTVLMRAADAAMYEKAEGRGGPGPPPSRSGAQRQRPPRRPPRNPRPPDYQPQLDRRSATEHRHAGAGAAAARLARHLTGRPHGRRYAVQPGGQRWAGRGPSVSCRSRCEFPPREDHHPRPRREWNA